MMEKNSVQDYIVTTIYRRRGNATLVINVNILTTMGIDYNLLYEYTK